MGMSPITEPSGAIGEEPSVQMRLSEWSNRVYRFLMPPGSATLNFWFYGAAILLPFGWLLLLARVVPVRVLARSVRSRFDSSYRP
jgi:hypothetical protein